MFHIESIGNYDKTLSFLEFLRSGDLYSNLDYYGRIGVDALAAATPVDTGLLQHSWGYQIGHSHERYSITWFNTDIEGGLNIAIIVQYGHGTGTGGYVEGRDYINPAIQPIFDRMVVDIWRQVINA